MIAQDLWQAHYQVLYIIFLKEFIELNVDNDKNVKRIELNISIATVLKTNITTNFKDNFNRTQMFLL